MGKLKPWEQNPHPVLLEGSTKGEKKQESSWDDGVTSLQGKSRILSNRAQPNLRGRAAG